LGQKYCSKRKNTKWHGCDLTFNQGVVFPTHVGENRSDPGGTWEGGDTPPSPLPFPFCDAKRARIWLLEGSEGICAVLPVQRGARLRQIEQHHS